MRPSILAGLSIIYPSLTFAQGSIQDLGTRGSPFAVSADGATVVGARIVAGSTGETEQAFRWTSANGLQALPDGVSGWPYSIAYGVSADGSIVVGATNQGQGTNTYLAACVWRAPQWSVELLPSIGGSTAYGVSADGTVIVGVGQANANLPTGAVKWLNGTIQNLPAFQDQPTIDARAVNGIGTTTVGSSYTPGTSVRAVLWSSSGPASLGSLFGTLSPSYAQAISDSGNVVVGYASAGNGVTESFRWSISGGMVGLGHLQANPGLDETASGVSGDGQIIVGWATQNNDYCGFIWQDHFNMMPLWSVASASGVNLGSWYSFGRVFGISQSGTVITGMGHVTNDQNAHMFVLTLLRRCYANCDGSTVAPVVTANDFQCFLNAFAAGQSYANCDGSTVTPLLTANDFQCFLNAFSASCP
jgi:probable HAF family extracellular repeat protein